MFSIRFLGVIITTLLFGCGSNEESQIRSLANSFDLNKDKFETIRLYIIQNPDSIAAIFMDDKESITVKIKGDTYQQKSLSINPLKNSKENNILLKDYTSFKHTLHLLGSLGVHSVGGNEKFVSFSFNHGFSDCSNLYYRSNPYSEIDTAIEFRKVYIKEKYWYFLLNNNWYLKKEKCF